MTPPAPIRVSHLTHCTPKEHQFVQLGDQLPCICGKMRCAWVVNNVGLHLYDVVASSKGGANAA